MLGILVRDVARHGDVVVYQKLDHRVFLMRHPQHVRHVLESHHTNYRRSSTYDVLKMALGEGLLTVDGAVWRQQRRLLQPFFGKEDVAKYSGVAVERIAAMADRWEERAAPSVELDVASELSRVFLDVACRTLFGCAAGKLEETIQWALRDILAEVDRRMNEIGHVVPPVSRAREESLAKAIGALRTEVAALVARRRSMTHPAPDLFEGLRGAQLADRQVEDQVTTMLIAGHDTTSTQMTWTLYLLKKHPEHEAALRQEVDQVLGDRLPAPQDVAALRLCGQVLKESMRLYPPLWSIDREAIADDRIVEHEVPAGSVVMLSPYFTHRHPDFWPDPERFDPGRFDPAAERVRPKYAFFPFGGGPRTCIGKDLAQSEAVLALAILLQRFDFAMDPDRVVRMKPAVVLRPKGGLPLTVTPRRIRSAGS